jgi:hypothetical protein
MPDIPGIARGMGMWVQMRPVSTPEHPVPETMQCARCKIMADPHTMWRAAISTVLNRQVVNPVIPMYLHCAACMMTTDPTQAWVDANAD